jgi:hypothetical protein
MENLESAFHLDMLNIYKEASKLGYKPTIFLGMVNEHGGLKAAKLLIEQKEVTEGYLRLWELRRLDLSVEAFTLKPEYSSLFSKEIKEKCIARLHKYEYHFYCKNCKKN